MTPFELRSAAELVHSPRTDPSTALDDPPLCSVMLQNVQPPKHPRMIVTRVLDHLVAGTGSE